MRGWAFPYYVCSGLGVTMVTEFALWVLFWVDYVVVSSHMVVSSHKLDHYSPLPALEGEHLLGPLQIHSGPPLFGLPTFLRVP